MRGMLWCWLLVALFGIGGCDAGFSWEPVGPGETAAATSEATSGEARQQIGNRPGDLERKQPPRVIVLTNGSHSASRLSEELVRQSFLATAREEFGVPVRDESLGEDVPAEEPKCWFMELYVRPLAISGPGSVSVIRYRPQSAGSWGPSLKIELPPGIVPASIFARADDKPHATPDLETLVDWASDQSETFAGYLRDVQGLKPQHAKQATDKEPSTVDIELRLREMSFVAQFEAVRAAHALLAGPEKDRLLAVGYANLGVLTQHLWSPAWKVFAARSLIYAERAARSAPGEAASEVQAYATAMAGLHAAALRHAVAAGDSPSPRLQAISAYCRFRHDELAKLADASPEIRDLAELLACLTIEPTAQNSRIAERYSAVIESNPDCFRVYDVAHVQGLISLQHDVTLRGPSQLTQSVPARLRAVPGLPKSVRELVAAESALPAELADRLEAELGPVDVRQEPSWPVLGRLIRDEALIQAHRRLDFLRSPLGVPAGEEYEAFRKFVGEHPYDVVLDLLSDEPVTEEMCEAVVAWTRYQRDVPKKGDRWFPTHQFGPRHESLVATVVPLVPLTQQERQTLHDYKRFADWTAEDLVVLMDGRYRRLTGETFSEVDAAKALGEISPHHPFRALALMQQEEIAAEDWQAWENDYADRPSLLVPLAAAMLANDKVDDAARVAAKAAELEPTFEAFNTLAKAHLAAGREADYVSALEQAFEQPSFGLADTRSRVDLAQLYMSRGEFEKAEPHAAAAAESYAAWAIDCAIDCYTGLKEWETAEGWLVRRHERYPNNPVRWYLWCLRTGHGHVDAAEELAEAWARTLDTPLDEMGEQELHVLGLYRLVTDDNETAGDLLAQLARRKKFPASGLIATAGYLRAGNTDAAKKLLKECSGWQGDAAMRAGVFLKSLESGEPPNAETLREFDQAIDGFGEQEQRLWRAIFGEIFVQLGARDEGTDLLRRAATAPQNAVIGGSDRFEQTFATVWLREHVAEDAKAADSSKEPADEQDNKEEPDA